MPKEYFAKKGKNRSGGGPFMMGSYGLGKNPITFKSPAKSIMDFDDFKKVGKLSSEKPKEEQGWLTKLK